MNVGIVGWNGHSNLGDDLMAEVICSVVKKKYPNANFYFLADKSSMPLFQKITYSAYEKYGRRINSKLKIFYNLIYYPLIFAFNKDILIFGGGSIFQSERVIFKAEIIRKIAKIFNPKLKCYAIGVSLGPFKSEKAEKKCEVFLSKLDKVLVRDRSSFSFGKEFLEKSKLRYLPDLVLALPFSTNLQLEPIKYDEKNVIGISLRYGRLSNDMYKYISSLLNDYLNEFENIKLRFFYFSGSTSESDKKESLKLINKLKPEYKNRVEEVDYSIRVEDRELFFQKIRECKWVLCVRLHSLILSYLFSKNVYLISYHKKCIDFGEDVLLKKSFIYSDNIEREKVLSTWRELLLNNSVESFDNKKEDYFDKIQNGVEDLVQWI